MNSAQAGLQRKLFAPDAMSFCLCGSGARFRNCCKGRLPGFNNDKKWRAAAKQKRWVEMVRHLRADLTQYTIWHLTNTAPAVARKPELRDGYFMNIDIEALSDYVSNLMWGYARNGWQKKLPDVLDRLRSNIDDPRWLTKIAYHRAICALWRGDREGAAVEISHLQPITPKFADVDLLQLHLDLHGARLGMIERIAFFDSICERTKSPSDKLHYGGARAFEILLNGDEDGAQKAFEEVIALGRDMEAETPFGATAELWFCRALEGRAMFGRNPELFAEIDKRLTRQLNDPNAWNDAGRANLLRSLGDTRRYGGLFEAAAATYRASYNLVAAPELRIFEAECKLHIGEPDEAYRLVRSVAVDKLDLPQRADHAFTSFYIALKRGDRRSLLDARDLLRAAKTPQPYFETRRLQHIITIGEALEALQNQQALPELHPIMAGLQRLNRYVMLQPNWNGVGLNANVIVEDVVAYAKDRAKRQADEIPTYPKDASAAEA